MHIYQPMDLFIGVLMLPMGLIGLGIDLHRVLTHTFKNRYGDWRSLGLSLWFVTGGPAHLSKAFDQPHHLSHLTDVLETIELIVLCFILIGSGVAWIIRKRQKAESREAEAAMP